MGRGPLKNQSDSLENEELKVSCMNDAESKMWGLERNFALGILVFEGLVVT